MGLKWFAPNKVGSESILPNKDMNADTRLPIMIIANPIEILILKKFKFILKFRELYADLKLHRYD